MIPCAEGFCKQDGMADRQLSLAESLMHPGPGVNARVDAIAEVIDWAPLEALALNVRKATTGRPPYPAGVMIRSLYL